MALWVGLPIAGALALLLLGVSPRDAVLLLLVVLVQAIAGGYLWRLATESRAAGPAATPGDPVALLGGALALGTGAAALSGAVLSLVGFGPLGWLLPTLVAVVLWIVRRLQGRRLAPAEWRFGRASLLGFAVAMALGLATITLNVARYPLSGPGPWSTYHEDMLYFEALSTSTGRFGGGDALLMAGGDLRYHWFTYGWVGQVAETVGAQPFATLTRVLPLIALIGTAALVVSWTARLVDRWPATVLAALLLTAGGYLGAANGTILNFDSPSQNLTTLWLVGALVAGLAYVAQSSAGRLRSLALLLVAVVLVAATTGGKISSAAVALVPLGVLALVLSVRRDPSWRRAWLLVACSAIAAGVVYVVFVSGSASSGDLKLLSLLSRASSVQGLDSSPGTRGIVLGTLTLMLAMAARWWGLAWLVRDRDWRGRPDVVLGLGLVLVGLVPVVLLSQGVNETWFALAASAPLAAISAAGVAVAWQRVNNRTALMGALVAAGIAVVVVPLVWIPDVIYPTSVRFYGPWIGYGIALLAAVVIGVAVGRRQWRGVGLAAFITVLVVASSVSRVSPVIAGVVHGGSTAEPTVTDIPTLPAAVGAESTAPGPDAAASQAPADAPASVPLEPPAAVTAWTSAEVEAANFLRSASDRASVIVTNDTNSYVVPALTGQQAFIAGAPYQSLYGSADSVSAIPERVATSQAFLRGLDSTAFATLCSTDVEWGWVRLDATPLRSWQPYAETAFANDAVAVIRIDQDRCP